MNYYDIQRISSSAISCIDPELGGHPEKYKDFIEGRYSQESPSMSLGDIIHRHLLLGESFVALEKKPGEVITSIIDAYVDQLWAWDIPDPAIDSDKQLLLQLIREHNYYNNRKDDTVVEGIIREGEEYFNFLLMNSGKTVVAVEWKAILDKLACAVIRTPVDGIFNPRPQPDLEVLSEKEVFFEIISNGYEKSQEAFECKAKIDRLIIDHASRTYRIIDLKSTSGSLEQFAQSVRRYKYHRQLAFYREAVRHLVPDGYTLDGVYILALETTGYCRARLFAMDNELLKAGEQDYLGQLLRISYHRLTNNWVYPMEEEVNRGIYCLEME